EGFGVAFHATLDNPKKGASRRLTIKAPRRGASILHSSATTEDGRNATMATATLPPGSLQSMVGPATSKIKTVFEGDLTESSLLPDIPGTEGTAVTLVSAFPPLKAKLLKPFTGCRPTATCPSSPASPRNRTPASRRRSPLRLSL